MYLVLPAFTSRTISLLAIIKDFMLLFVEYTFQTSILTLIPLMWRIGWAPNNASRWQMGFKSAFKGLISSAKIERWCVPFNLKPFWFIWTLRMAYLTAKLKINGDRTSLCFKLSLIENKSNSCLPGTCYTFHLNTFH